MICSYCLNVALYKVGQQGFCKAHKALSLKARKNAQRWVEAKKRRSSNWMNRTDWLRPKVKDSLLWLEDNKIGDLK